MTVDGVLARLAGVPSRRAAFREQRRFGALEGVLESSGHLVLRPGYVEKSTEWPQVERLQVEGDRVVVTAGNEAPRVVELGVASELRGLVDAIRGPLSGDGAAVRRAFVATASGTDAGWVLALVPREAATARVLQGVQLEGHGDWVDRLTVTQANGDEQAMTITPQ